MNGATVTARPPHFSGASGRGVRIAVIDSGVNLAHPHVCALTHGVVLDGSPFASADDEVGHGTAVMAAIQEKAPEAEYYAVKLFGAALRTSASLLVEAIEWAIQQRMDLVNLSLGTPNPERRPELEALVERAARAGVLLIAAARHGSGQPAFPGALDGVIGVEVDWDLPRHSYCAAWENGKLGFWASGYPRHLPGVAPSRNLNGISFAVANMTGFAARACQGLTNRSFGRVRESLAAAADWSFRR